MAEWEGWREERRGREMSGAGEEDEGGWRGRGRVEWTERELVEGIWGERDRVGEKRKRETK